jgi:hypothetical protein
MDGHGLLLRRKRGYPVALVGAVPYLSYPDAPKAIDWLVALVRSE